MGFKWMEDGVVTPIAPGAWSLQPHAQSPSHVFKARKTADGKGETPFQKEPLVLPGSQKGYQKQAQQERRPAILASQIMAFPVVTLPPEATMAEAWELIRTKRFRHVPVVSRKKGLVGIISDRDLLLEAGNICSTVSQRDNAGHEQMTIQGLIRRRVLTASHDTGIREIARILFEERIGSMPIVDDKGVLVGIITRSDILRTIINNAPLDLWI